jgi:hypothetical protein
MVQRGVVAKFAAVTCALVASLLVAPAGARAESYAIESGQVFTYRSCWSGKPVSAVLQRKSGQRWVVAAKGKVRKAKASECEKGYRTLVSYRWKPRTIGTFTLRERMREASGQYSTSGTMTLTVTAASPTYVPPPVYVPPSGSKLFGCTYKGKRLWGSVYISNSPYLVDATVAFSSLSYLADLRVYSTSSSYLASSCGLWYLTTSPIGADLTVYVTSSTYLADFTVYEVSSSVLAGT